MKRFVAIISAFAILTMSCVVMCFTESVAVKSEPAQDEYYVFENSIVEAQGKLNPVMANYAIALFDRVHGEKLLGCDNIYFAIIPDKEMLIEGNEESYFEFYSYFEKRLVFADFIDIFSLLEFSDYYRTDPHLRQETLIDIAKKICEKMGTVTQSEYNVNKAVDNFKGAYSKQSGLEVGAEELCYLTGNVIDNLKVSESIKLYDFDKLSTDEPYEFFLSGNHPVVTIKNENTKSDRKLVVFRDSFANNLAPLLCENYGEVVLVDFRYVMSEYVSELVDFENADVLFLYSTLLLNNSMSMK